TGALLQGRLQVAEGDVGGLEQNHQSGLQGLGPMHPGSLSKQYSVCGRAGCKCIDPTNPQPHGPYTKLTFAHKGRFTCRFVRAESVAEVTAMVRNYKKFRRIIAQLVDLAIQRAKLGPLCPGPQLNLLRCRLTEITC
ncbi:MAG: hypothetical protein QHJ82_07395, partial [Verrucomicrobiota bacterium]|nr:hypothetical protein [Verrucomicrobiota bacterium]